MPEVSAKFIRVNLIIQNRSTIKVQVRRVVIVYSNGTQLTNLSPQSSQAANVISTVALSTYIRIINDSKVSRQDTPYDNFFAFYEKSAIENPKSIASVIPHSVLRASESLTVET
jgi:hypothetical protein